MSNASLGLDDLPNSLRLPPRLSAHKYFFVCTLTVAAWDTLVLSPKSWTLFRMEGWPILKTIFFFLRFFMPAEFIVVGMSLFSLVFIYLRRYNVKALVSLTPLGRDRSALLVTRLLAYPQLPLDMSKVLLV